MRPELAPKRPDPAPEKPEPAPERPRLSPERPEPAPERPEVAPERPELASRRPKLAPERFEPALERPNLAFQRPELSRSCRYIGSGTLLSQQWEKPGILSDCEKPHLTKVFVFFVKRTQMRDYILSSLVSLDQLTDSWQ